MQVKVEAFLIISTQKHNNSMKPIDTFSHKDSKSTPIDFYKAMKLLGKVLMTKKKAFNENYSHFQMIDKRTIGAYSGGFFFTINTELQILGKGLVGKRFLYDFKTGDTEIGGDQQLLNFDSVSKSYEKDLIMFLITKEQLQMAKGKNLLFKTPETATSIGFYGRNLHSIPNHSCVIDGKTVKFLLEATKTLKCDSFRLYSDFKFEVNEYENLCCLSMITACDSSGNEVMKGMVSLSCGKYSDEKDWVNSVNEMTWNELSCAVEGVEFLKLN